MHGGMVKYTRKQREDACVWRTLNGASWSETSIEFSIPSPTLRSHARRALMKQEQPRDSGTRKPRTSIPYGVRLMWADRILSGEATAEFAALATGAHWTTASNWARRRDRMKPRISKGERQAMKAEAKADTERRRAEARQAFIDAAPRCPNCGMPAYYERVKPHYVPQVYAKYCGNACELVVRRFPKRARLFVARATRQHITFTARIRRQKANHRRALILLAQRIRKQTRSPLLVSMRHTIRLAQGRAHYDANREAMRAASRERYADNEWVRKGDRERGAIRRFGEEWAPAFIAILELQDVIARGTSAACIEDRQ